MPDGSRDQFDRRRVLVELIPDAAQQTYAYYAEHARHSERLYERYTEDQLKLILEFVRDGRELNEREAAVLEQRTQVPKS